jgi:hypothetical protein
MLLHKDKEKGLENLVLRVSSRQDLSRWLSLQRLAQLPIVEFIPLYTLLKVASRMPLPA